jgi:hypothetical protein
MSLLTMIVVAMLSIGFTSCGDDDENENPNNEQPVNPGTTVNDPEGTISLSMRNADNGKTYLDNIYISNENFRGAYFASVGAVKGLGNVSTIPTTGWAEQMSVIAGNGYVAYNNDKYYRIYVVDDIVATTGGIIGADIKYQKPFKGVDEAIQLPKTEVTLNANTGSSEEIIFKNRNIVLYSVSSDQSWCRVQKCSTNDNYFLYNGVYITCEENSSSSSREAIVSIKTVYDKEAKIKVIQTGQEPFITMGSSSIEVTSREQTSSLSFVTNVDVSELEITGATSWCKAEILTANSTRVAVKFIGNSPVQNTRASGGASQSYSLKLQFSENKSEDERVANITIKSSKYNIHRVVKVVQKGVSFWISQNNVVFDKNSNSVTITITTTASSWNAKSSSDWCTFSNNGNQMTIRSTATTKDRDAIISFPGFKQQIRVHQSKYAVGDDYSENGITGFVGYICTGVINDTLSYVVKDLNKMAKWSEELIATGANSSTDGVYNMAIIKRIAIWKDLYPAFYLCDQLNIGSVSGWYLPAADEIEKMAAILPRKLSAMGIWLSTELNNQQSFVYYFDNYGYSLKYTAMKDGECSVIAVHRF